jgi:hypothetical protein
MVQDGLPIHNHSGPPSQRGAEQYPAEPSVEALLPVEQLPHGLWEQCGKSDSPLVRTLEARGHRVIAHDLIRDGIDSLISEMRERGCSQQSVMFAVDRLSHKEFLAGVLIHEITREAGQGETLH